MERIIRNIPSPLLADEIKNRGKLLLLRQKAYNKLHRDELIKTAELLNASGYDVTLMKGISYDLDDEDTRAYVDVDLLVDADRICEIISLLENNHYRYEGSFILSRKEKEDIESQLA